MRPRNGSLVFPVVLFAVLGSPGVLASPAGSTLRGALDGLYPGDTTDHLRANVSMLEKALASCDRDDQWLGLAYQRLGIQYAALHEPEAAVVYFRAAAGARESVPLLRLHALQSEMTALSALGLKRKAIAVAEKVVSAARGTKEEATATSNALFLEAQWIHFLSRGQSDGERRTESAYQRYLKAAAARPLHESPSLDLWDANALGSLDASLRRQGRFKEEIAVDERFMRSFPERTEAIYFALQKARALDGGRLGKPGMIAAVLQQYPRPSSARSLVLREYALILAESHRKSDLNKAVSLLKEAFSYQRQPYDTTYNAMTLELCGEDLAKLLDRQNDLLGETQTLSQVRARFQDRSPSAAIKIATNNGGSNPNISRFLEALAVAGLAIASAIVIVVLLVRRP